MPKEASPELFVCNLFVVAAELERKATGPLDLAAQRSQANLEALEEYVRTRAAYSLQGHIDDLEGTSGLLSESGRRQQIAGQLSSTGIIDGIIQGNLTSLQTPEFSRLRRSWHISIESEHLSEIEYDAFQNLINERLEQLLGGKVIAVVPAEGVSADEVFVPDINTPRIPPEILEAVVVHASGSSSFIEVTATDQDTTPYRINVFGQDEEKQQLRVKLLKIIDV